MTTIATEDWFIDTYDRAVRESGGAGMKATDAMDACLVQYRDAVDSGTLMPDPTRPDTDDDHKRILHEMRARRADEFSDMLNGALARLRPETLDLTDANDLEAMRVLGKPFSECNDAERDAVEFTVDANRLIDAMNRVGAKIVGDPFGDTHQEGH